MDKNKSTPVMQQFWDIKENHPDSIILFRMGDFYETFEKDAEITSDVLGIALTKRSNGAASSVPLAGFPYHSLEQYLDVFALDAGFLYSIPQHSQIKVTWFDVLGILTPFLISMP